MGDDNIVDSRRGHLISAFLTAGLESRIVSEGVTKAKYERLKVIWDRCIKLEKAFWDVALEVGAESPSKLKVEREDA